jgi:hypothetical protein
MSVKPRLRSVYVAVPEERWARVVMQADFIGWLK